MDKTLEIDCHSDFLMGVVSGTVTYFCSLRNMKHQHKFWSIRRIQWPNLIRRKCEGMWN